MSLHQLLADALAAATFDEAVRALQRLFVDGLSFDPAGGSLPLDNSGGVTTAARVAVREGVNVVALQVREHGRIPKHSLDRALDAIGARLDGEVWLLAADADLGQWHFVYASARTDRRILRRIVVYRGQSLHPAADQLEGIARDLRQRVALHSALERAYDVDTTTRHFRQQYARTFDQVMRLIQGLPDQEERKLFCQQLLNRLMFLYFLQRKAWLRINGRTDYLEALWDAVRDNPDENIYASRLVPLFFVALTHPRDAEWNTIHRPLEQLIGQVPLLNGGLFAPQEFDRCSGVMVPNEAIRLIVCNLLTQFSFTVTESTPDDQEVAVDPEMLGTVFEELVTGRHATGAYYTPRPVVEFMCRHALKAYLRSRVDLADSAVTALIDERTVRHLTLQQRHALADALDQVSAVDPACGSGAYLLGMLRELTDLHLLLRGRTTSAPYDLKLRVIERNLYGADLDPFAINIARLRLWLSLAIDSDGANPEPLPNLELKLICADSLRAQQMPPGMSTSVCLDWRTEFPEIVERRNGFDIVVTNPPYGIGVKGPLSDCAGTSESYAAFITLSSAITAVGGIAVHIVPTSWETGERFSAFRKWLFRKNRVDFVVNLPYDIFRAAFVDTCILAMSPGSSTFDQADIALATLPKHADADFSRLHAQFRSTSVAVVQGDPRLRLTMSADAQGILASTSNYPRLDTVVRIKRGIEAYQYSLETSPGDGLLPFYGGQVRRYTAGPEAAALHVRPRDLDREWHIGERLLVRRLVSRSNRLMAARTHEPCVVKKDLYVIKARIDGVPLTFLLGLLNSALWSYLYLVRSASATKDDFRQVTLTGLRDLPLPPTLRLADTVESLVNRIERTPSKDPSELEARLDEIIFDAYELTHPQRDTVRHYLEERG